MLNYTFTRKSNLMEKQVRIKGYDLEAQVVGKHAVGAPEIFVKGSSIDFGAQPEKVVELLKVLGLPEDVSVDVRVTSASTIVE
jgi:hypothetical protein